MTTFRNDALVNELAADFITRNDAVNRWGNAVSSFQAVPGLVGFWPMSSVQRSTGNVYDLSGQSRTLTYNGNPTFNYSGLVPYADLDGVGDYLSRADETDLDVLGTETIYAAAVRGLTFGGYFQFGSLAATSRPMGKDDLGANRSYGIFAINAPTIGAIINGATSVTSTVTPATGQWYNIIVRFTPSTELAVFVNGVPTVNVAAIPAAINNTAAAFTIGASGAGTQLMTGYASLCFLSANALSDAIINALFNQTRSLFGV